MNKSIVCRSVLGVVIALMLTASPFFYYRASYSYAKRLREVEPGKLYRSGQLSADGFADAVERYGIRTIVNLQDEAPDPDVYESYFNLCTVKESELCRRLGVRHVYLPPDLVWRRSVPASRPAAIDRFLEIMDDPENWPVLVHCRAGLHRTGCLVAVYRMEYNGWGAGAAMQELKDNGFGRFPCSAANDYIVQYVLTFQPRR